MKTLNVTIKLDPVNDGAVWTENSFEKKEEGALIIGTNGKFRIADAFEANSILERLSEVEHGEYLGSSNYIALFNADKIINFETGKCFIGSAIILKYEHEKLSLLAGEEFREAAGEFESRLITIVGDGQEFSALELF